MNCRNSCLHLGITLLQHSAKERIAEVSYLIFQSNCTLIIRPYNWQTTTKFILYLRTRKVGTRITFCRSFVTYIIPGSALSSLVNIKRELVWMLVNIFVWWRFNYGRAIQPKYFMVYKAVPWICTKCFQFSFRSLLQTTKLKIFDNTSGIRLRPPRARLLRSLFARMWSEKLFS